jgi:hypothetical protein
LSVDRLKQRVSGRVEPLERGGGRALLDRVYNSDIPKTSVTHALHDALIEVDGACPESSYDIRGDENL